jgi:threonine dehydrogenase-like Zn-dependent dehydrogenase
MLKDWLGKMVFSFSPHASHAVVHADAAIKVTIYVYSKKKKEKKGIVVKIYTLFFAVQIPQFLEDYPEEAVFLPSMETAVSLAQDCCPMLGDSVAVIGQGLIGVLTGAVLEGFGPSIDLTVVDIDDGRLHNAASVISPAIKRWNPSKHKLPPHKFDACIEVSGNIGGLQTCIDHTKYGGKIIAGSWYSDRSRPLFLGLGFHRSHITIKASQVSSIPAYLSDRWDYMLSITIEYVYLLKSN